MLLPSGAKRGATCDDLQTRHERTGAAMSNRLPILAYTIRGTLRMIGTYERETARCAISVGQMLLEAKQAVKHGEWLPFLREAGIGEWTAQRYMALAGSGFKYDTVTDLGGIAGALRFLRLRKLAVEQMERAAREVEDDPESDDHLVSFETSMLLLDWMIDLFPPEETGAAVQ